MNLEILAKEWLLSHEHYEHDPSFNNDLEDLQALLEQVAFYEGYIGDAAEYNPSVGDDTLCLCGHPYYRHFDPFENMDPVGCKYCSHWYDDYSEGHCAGFKEKKL